MKTKTSDLTGAALDWAVAICEGYTDWDGETEQFVPPRKAYGLVELSQLQYIADWSEGGSIIEREGISLTQFKEGEVDDEDVGAWCAAYDREDFGNDAKSCVGPTPLIAAMRCYVASKLGEVDVPKELT